MTSGDEGCILAVVKHDSASIGQRMAAQRRALFLTQRQLAERIREQGHPVTQSAIARWETGECLPALRHRQAIAAALMIAPHVLFVEEAVAS